MRPPRRRHFSPAFALFAAALLCLSLSGCGGKSGSGGPVEITILSSADKQAWIEQAVARFNKARRKISGKRVVKAQVLFAPNGEFARLSEDPARRIHAVIPSASWLLSAANLDPATPSRGRLFITPGTPVIRAPLVFLAYRSIAEQMGWLDSGLGWRDLAALAADPAFFSQASGGMPFSLSLPNPGYSHAGAMSLLAMAAVARGGARVATPADLESPAVAAMFSAFDSALPCYFPSSDALAATMAETAPRNLSVGVVFEHQAAARRLSKTHGPLVAIPPREGTWIADHPFTLVDRTWAGPAEQEAARLLLEHLLSADEQAAAEALGLRPVSRSPRRAPPFLPPDGLDPAEPASLDFEPDAALVQRAREIWQSVRRPFTILFLLDLSGSMAAREPSRLELSKRIIRGLARHASPEDRLALVLAGDPPQWAVQPRPAPEAVPLIESALDQAKTGGPTALHDSMRYILRALEASKPLRSPVALFVFSDGTDDESRVSFRSIYEELDNFTRDGSPFRVHTFSLDGVHGFDAMRRFALITGGRILEPAPETAESIAKEAAGSF